MSSVSDGEHVKIIYTLERKPLRRRSGSSLGAYQGVAMFGRPFPKCRTNTSFSRSSFIVRKFSYVCIAAIKVCYIAPYREGRLEGETKWVGISVDNKNLEDNSFLIEFTGMSQRLLWNVKAEARGQKNAYKKEGGGTDDSKTRKAIWKIFSD